MSQRAGKHTGQAVPGFPRHARVLPDGRERTGRSCRRAGPAPAQRRPACASPRRTHCSALLCLALLSFALLCCGAVRSQADLGAFPDNRAAVGAAEQLVQLARLGSAATMLQHVATCYNMLRPNTLAPQYDTAPPSVLRDSWRGNCPLTRKPVVWPLAKTNKPETPPALPCHSVPSAPLGGRLH